jgi:hypothetical protein
MEQNFMIYSPTVVRVIYSTGVKSVRQVVSIEKISARKSFGRQPLESEKRI